MWHVKNKGTALLFALGIFMLTLSGGASAGAVANYTTHNEYNGNPNTGSNCELSPNGPGRGTQNPIDVLSGNKYHEETLYESSGDYPLSFKLFYNSRHHGTVYGRLVEYELVHGKWTHSYSQHLNITDLTEIPGELYLIELVREDGQSVYFKQNVDKTTSRYDSAVMGLDGEPTLTADPYQFGFMIIQATIEYGLVYKYTSLDGVQEIYDLYGKLLEIKTNSFYEESIHKLTYTDISATEKKIDVVYAGRGKSLSIFLDKRGENWRPNRLTVVNGPDVEMVFDDINDDFIWFWNEDFCLPEECATTSTVPRLRQINWSNGGMTYFDYNARVDDVIGDWLTPTALTFVRRFSVPELSGDHEFYAMYEYDDSGRGTRSIHGDTPFTFTIDDSVSGYEQHNLRTVTNLHGLTTTYDFGPDSNGVLHVNEVIGTAPALSSCVGSNASYTYDSYGHLDTVVEKNPDTGVVERTTDYDFYPPDINYPPPLAKVNLLDKVTYLGVDNGADRVVDYDWHFVDKPSRIDGPNSYTTIDYDYSTMDVTGVNQVDTTPSGELPVGYVRQHSTSRSWQYSYTYFPDVEGESEQRIETITETGPRGSTNLYTYDISGNLLSMTNHYGHTVTFSDHDSYSNPGTMVDANGGITQLFFAPDGRLMVVITSNWDIFQFEYNTAGQIKSALSASDGKRYDFSYSTAGELNGVTNEYGERLQMDRYNFSETKHIVTQTFTAAGDSRSSKRNIFDALGRLYRSNNVTDTFPAHEYLYDSWGNMTTIKDGVSGQISPMYQVFDALGRLTDINDTREANHHLTVGYDKQDRITRVTNSALGYETTYIYDGLGNLLQENSPSTGIKTYYYDDAGNVVESVDADNNVVRYSYDMLNRLETIDYAIQPDVTYHYDATSTGGETNYGIGRMTGMTSSDGRSIDFIYDISGNLIKDIRTFDGASYETAYEYGTRNRLSAIHYPSGNIIDYVYTNADLTGLTLRNSSKTLVSGITHEPFGPLSNLLYGNGLSLSWQYDVHFRPQSLDSGGKLELSYLYKYSTDNIETITDLLSGVRTQNLGYDDLERLNSAVANSGYGTFGYTYDALGNRQTRDWSLGGDAFSEIYNYDIDKHLQNVTSTSGTKNYTYTNTGSVQSINNTTFHYDDSGRITSVDDSGTEIASYSYNPLGQRETKTANRETRHFVYGLSGQLLWEATTDGKWQRDYVYLEGRLIAMIDTDHRGIATVYYVHSDHLGTPQAITDDNQQIVWEASYSPFGDAQIHTADIENNVRFPGQYFDQETGMHYNYFRYYDPSLGRYITSDPIGLAGGMNTYAYVQANPINNLDMFGLDTISLTTNVQVPQFISDMLTEVKGVSGMHFGIAIEFPGFNGGQWDFAGFFGPDFMFNLGLGKASLNLGYDVGGLCDLGKSSLERAALVGIVEFGTSYDYDTGQFQGGHVGVGVAPGRVFNFIKSLIKGNKLAKAYANNMISVGVSENVVASSIKRDVIR